MTTGSAQQPQRSIEDIAADMLNVLAQVNAAEWALGDLALEAHGSRSLPTGRFKSGKLAQLADLIGFSYGEVFSWAYTAHAWPESQRGTDVPWQLYRELAGWDDRAKLLKDYVAKCT